MKYSNAKDAFEELKNFEGKADFKGVEVPIEYFVLLPKGTMDGFNLKDFLNQYNAHGSFEVEGSHDDSYTILGINATKMQFTNDTDYLLKLLVW